MVSEINYAGGDTWKAAGLEQWAKDITSSFDVNSFSQTVESLKPSAALAETNDYANVTVSKKARNQFSSSDDIDFTIKI